MGHQIGGVLPAGGQNAPVGVPERVGAGIEKLIRSGLESGLKLREVAAVRSPDHKKVGYVAGVIEGPGVDGDTVGVWA